LGNLPVPPCCSAVWWPSIKRACPCRFT